ncbi:LPXTG-motif cell wall anchor domain-containing protein [Amycolatopsis arida]|uniref:LPXTG-motif cell wall anchor domain-containing protein n=1 Tax=Amycolatopsis arida TaxID=587909 RepID=A0A1I5Q137_9PSEU|nr:LPXTG-motif cell wall-anchored protein [Amycolatopsis arida]SFP39917.1 LPXTG-motif cell wall anchor domain-containing protein [Amycolatopsis arida]
MSGYWGIIFGVLSMILALIGLIVVRRQNRDK